MKLFMTLLVRDNQDIVAANIGYHLSRGVDHIIVTDNASTDETVAIIEGFAHEGNITLLSESGDDYSQSVWVTRMARLAADMGADWVIHNDADEMWWPLKGDLKTTLEQVPTDCGSVMVERSNMLPLRRLDGHPFEQMVLRYVRSVNGLGEPLPGKVAHRAAADIEVRMGNHSVVSPSLGPSRKLDAITVFHYPYRSYAEFERKIAAGGAALARNRTLSPAMGNVWRELYRRLQENTLATWYDALPHAGDADVMDQIARGEIIEDTRLACYLRETVFAGKRRSPEPPNE